VVLLVRGKTRAAIAWLAGAGVQAALTLAIFGRSIARSWWSLLVSPEYAGFLHTERASRMGSLVPMLRSLTPPGWAYVADWAGVALGMGLVLWTIRRMLPGQKGPGLDDRTAWALACLTTLIVSPHLFSYDLALLVLPIALVAETSPDAMEPARVPLVWLFGLTWTAGLRVAFEHLRWPLGALGASWTALPMLMLWRRVPTMARAALTGPA
jgi:hypothetical protein